MPLPRLISLALIFGLWAGLVSRPQLPADARSRSRRKARVRVKRGHAAGVVKTGWRKAVRALSFGPKGQLLAAAGDARQILLHDVAKGQRRTER